MWHEVCCQRFFVGGKESSYFQVAQPLQDDVLHHPPVQKGQPRGQALLRALVDKQLDQRTHDLNAASRPYQDRATASEVSPWLEMNRWPSYFDGLVLSKVAPLAYMPNPITEPKLQILAVSLRRIIKQARKSILEDRIGAFDQVKINSFMPGNVAVALLLMSF